MAVSPHHPAAGAPGALLSAGMGSSRFRVAFRGRAVRGAVAAGELAGSAWPGARAGLAWEARVGPFPVGVVEETHGILGIAGLFIWGTVFEHHCTAHRQVKA